METKFSFRFAESTDIDSGFVSWVLKNSQIPLKDIQSATRENNPTAVYLVIEKEEIDEQGVSTKTPVVIAPFYCQLNLACLGFNPETNTSERKIALGKLLSAVSAFSLAHGIREITVQTAKDYPVARWARQHKFEPEDRQTYKLRLPKLEEVAPFMPEEVADVLGS